MPTALLSVYDKTGIVDFASELHALGWSLVSTGGTARALRAASLPVRDVESLTGFPEMLDGRVKTLHPAVHGGLLARRDLPEHMSAIAEHDIGAIDMVVVNLYPFRETAARPGVSFEDVVEQIDIGGPSMLRSAAKNHSGVWPLVDPADYAGVLETLRGGSNDEALRRLLAEKVFAHTAAYDAAIATWFAARRGERFPDDVTMHAHRAQALRYGENPGQEAAFYVDGTRSGLAALVQRGGKELSFNNLLDVDAAVAAAAP